MFPFLAVPAAILVGLTAIVLVGSPNWRWRILALSLQYVGVFVLAAVAWPPALAVVKLVAGWMAGALLGFSRSASPAAAEVRRWPVEWVFRSMAAVLVLLSVASVVPAVLAAIPGLSAAQAWGGLFLMGMGLLMLGFSTRTLPVILSLLMFLSGFEILYAAVEVSTLVAGLLAIVHLSLALVGSYLLETERPEAAL